MSRVKGKLTTADYLSIDEFNRLCECFHEDKQYFWELYARLSYCTALRVSDVLSLTWQDILDQPELIKKEKKTGKTRTIKFNASVRNKLRILYQLLECPGAETLIFANAKTNKPYSREHINRRLKVFRMKYRLKIKAFSTHTFRKTFGREVYESMDRSDESLVLLNRIFKHTSINTTMAYIGITSDEINKVYNHIKF